MKRFIACGGSRYTDSDFVYESLDRLRARVGDFTVVYGGDPGAGLISALWASSNGLPIKVFPPDRKRSGDRAKGLRNTRMVRAGADGCVAFPGDDDSDDVVRKARAAGIKVWEPAAARGRRRQRPGSER